MSGSSLVSTHSSHSLLMDIKEIVFLTPDDKALISRAIQSVIHSVEYMLLRHSAVVCGYNTITLGTHCHHHSTYSVSDTPPIPNLKESVPSMNG